MAYPHTQYQVNLMGSGAGVAANTSGTVGGTWEPGFVPHVIRSFAIVNSSTIADQSLSAYVLERGTLSGSATDATVVGLATIHGTATGGAGVVFYKGDLNATIAPGQDLRFHITTAANAASLIKAVVWVEPKWEEPGNIPAMKLTT